MFTADPHSMRQQHQADMQVAHQRRTRGKVVTPLEHRWHRVLLTKLTPKRAARIERPTAAVQRNPVRTNTYLQLINGSTGPQIGG